MRKPVRRLSRSRKSHHQDQHRFEHWLVDNQVYFITARCRDRFPAFRSDEAKAIFWNRFSHYTAEAGFTPWVTTLLDNHYHTIGHLRRGWALPRMMQRIHGSVAKLVNDLLTERREDFWRDAKGQEYFDGCIRDEKQARLAYRYTLTQASRHHLVSAGRPYAHTRVNVDLERAIKRAHQLQAFLERVAYKRYAQSKKPAR